MKRRTFIKLAFAAPAGAYVASKTVGNLAAVDLANPPTPKALGEPTIFDLFAVGDNGTYGPIKIKAEPFANENGGVAYYPVDDDDVVFDVSQFMDKGLRHIKSFYVSFDTRPAVPLTKNVELWNGDIALFEGNTLTIQWNSRGLFSID